MSSCHLLLADSLHTLILCPGLRANLTRRIIYYLVFWEIQVRIRHTVSAFFKFKKYTLNPQLKTRNTNSFISTPPNDLHNPDSDISSFCTFSFNDRVVKCSARNKIWVEKAIDHGHPSRLGRNVQSVSSSGLSGQGS